MKKLLTLCLLLCTPSAFAQAPDPCAPIEPAFNPDWSPERWFCETKADIRWWLCWMDCTPPGRPGGEMDPGCCVDCLNERHAATERCEVSPTQGRPADHADLFGPQYAPVSR